MEHMILILAMILLSLGLRGLWRDTPITHANTPAPIVLQLPLQQDELQTETDETTLLENVPIASSGVELFPEADRESGRLFAVIGEFAPHIAGTYTDADGRDWFYLYFIENGEWMSAWALQSQFDLSGVDDEDLDTLPDIDPDDTPEMPDLKFNVLAVRPSGINLTTVTTSADGTLTRYFPVYNCTYLGNGQFEWYEAEVSYDESGKTIAETVLSGPHQGDWQNYCPANSETTGSDSGQSQGSLDSGNGDDGGSTIGGDVIGDEGGSTVGSTIGDGE